MAQSISSKTENYSGGQDILNVLRNQEVPSQCSPIKGHYPDRAKSGPLFRPVLVHLHDEF
jgi:hypothetical protein